MCMKRIEKPSDHIRVIRVYLWLTNQSAMTLDSYESLCCATSAQFLKIRRDRFQPFGKSLRGDAKTKPKIFGHSKAITRRQQDSARCDVATELTRINSTLQPWECGHTSARPYPTKISFVFSKELVKQLEICSCD